MTDTEFTAKERLRFRKLLEVAHSTTYTGERDAAVNAATRLAASHGMTLREAAGMAEAAEAAPPPPPRQRPRRPSGFPADFGAAGPENMGTWWRAERRHDEAMAEAVGRGLDAEERAARERAEKARERAYVRPKTRGSWRARPEFVRVLLTETAMSAKEIAAAAGVTVYDVFREKLLMRRSNAA